MFFLVPSCDHDTLRSAESRNNRITELSACVRVQEKSSEMKTLHRGACSWEEEALMKAATRVSRLIQEQGGKRHHDEYERLRIKVAAEEGYRTFSTCHYRDLGDPKEIEVAVATGLQGVADDRIGGDVEMVESGTSPYFRVPAGCVATWPGGGGTSADPGEISRRIEAEEVEASPEMLSAAKSAGWALAGPVVVFGPPGSTFSGPGVTVRLPLQNAGALMEERRAGLKVRVGAMKWHPAEGAGGEWREVAGAREDLEEGVVEVQADGFCAFTAYCQQLSEYEAQEKQLEAEIDETEEELKRGVESIQDHDELVAKKKRLEERLERTRERIRDLNARWDRMDYRYVSPGGQWDTMGGLPLFGSPHGQVMSNGGAAEPDSRRAMSQSDQRQGDASGQTACVGVDNTRASSRGRGGSKGKRYSYTDADKRIFTEFYLKPEEQEQKKRLGRKFYKTDALPRLMKMLPHINKDKDEAVWREYLRFVEDYKKKEGHATCEDRQSLSRSSSDDNVPAPEGL
jgi:hypothetical protein